MFQKKLKDCGFDDEELQYEGEELIAAQEETQPDLLPIMDCPTRWISTYTLLKRAIKLRRAIDDIATDSGLRKHELHDGDWLVLNDVFSFLEEFAQITTYVETSQYPMLSLIVPMYNKLLTFLEDVAHDKKKPALVVKGSKAGLRTFSTSYDEASPVMMVATYLDPRCKMQYFIDHGWNDGGQIDNAFHGTEENLINTRVKPA